VAYLVRGLRRRSRLLAVGVAFYASVSVSIPVVKYIHVDCAVLSMHSSTYLHSDAPSSKKEKKNFQAQENSSKTGTIIGVPLNETRLDGSKSSKHGRISLEPFSIWRKYVAQ
jgi:hypothetical protein